MVTIFCWVIIFPGHVNGKKNYYYTYYYYNSIAIKFNINNSRRNNSNYSNYSVDSAIVLVPIIIVFIISVSKNILSTPTTKPTSPQTSIPFNTNANLNINNLQRHLHHHVPPQQHCLHYLPPVNIFINLKLKVNINVINLNLKNQLLSPSYPSPSSSKLVTIDKSKCWADKFVCKFIDKFKAATYFDAMISCVIQLLSKIVVQVLKQSQFQINIICMSK